MKKPLAALFCLLLAGCTEADWNRTMNYVNPKEPEDMAAAAASSPPQVATAATAPATTPAAPANSEFCRAIATQDATGNGFDPATQQRVFAQSYAQCVTIYSK